MIKENQITICGHGSGNPSLKNMTTYLTSRYNARMSNGKRKGVLCVRRLKTMTDEKRQEFHDTYKTILGRNTYSQDRRNYVFKKYSNGKYYSDCSSSGMATMQRIGLNTGGLLNTVGIKNSPLFEEVPVKIENGHITNPEVLKVGDCILFAGNASRPSEQYCGHVEYVYEINGKVILDVDIKFETNDAKPESTGPKPFIGRVTAGALNIRTAAGTHGKLIGVFKKNDYVYITKVENNWGYANNKGWISLNYVDKKDAVKGKVTANSLNVRKDAGVTFEKITSISQGQTVVILYMNPDGTWGYDRESKGWVSLKYIEFDKV